MASDSKEFYNFRKTQVAKEFDAMFEEIRNSKIPEWTKKFTKNDRDDVCTYFLRGKVMEIQHLKDQILTYQNPGEHFTKQYRTFEGHCSKLQTDLDKIDVFGRDDLKTTRKQAFVELDEMIKILAGKAHSTGRTCAKCEVKS